MATKPPYWIVPTVTTPGYANLAKHDGLKGSMIDAYEYADTVAPDGIKKAIKSFYHDGRYVLYYNNENNYVRNTGVVVDLSSQGMPITTHSMKIISSHVDENENAYVLLENSTPTVDNEFNFQNYLDKQISFSNTFVYSGSDGDSIYKFDDGDGRLPILIRTGEQSLGTPSERKHFRQIELTGQGVNNGLLGVRVWIDGRYLCEGRITMTETSTCVRRVNIPVSKSVGYTIDVEISGSADIRGMEIKFEEFNR